MSLADGYLCDTNILLRIGRTVDPAYSAVESAVQILLARNVSLLYTLQNMAEFWNACTRPAERNGFGLSVAQTERAVNRLEQTFSLLPETAETYTRWRELVATYSVRGVQVHDARLVAAMQAHGVTRMLTLNGADFIRYEGILAVHPAEV